MTRLRAAMPRCAPIRVALACALCACVLGPGIAAAATNGPIAYIRTETADGSNPQIWLMGSDGANQGKLTNDNAANFGHPSFSNSGSVIAYSAQGPVSPDIFTMSFSGGSVADLAPDSGPDSSPALSPDGSKIAYSVYDGSDYEIWVRPRAGGAATQLTNNGSGVDDLNPGWSPDGAKLVFSSTRSGSYDIWVMNSSDGSSPVALTNTLSSATAQYIREQFPVWSPDGSTIAYSRMDSNQINDLNSFDIWLMSATGAGAHEATGSSATKDLQAAWSPDGAKIAFVSDRANAGNEIWAMDADGTDPVNLTKTAGPVAEAQPAWGTPQPPSASWTDPTLTSASANLNAKVASSCLSGTWYAEWSQGTELPQAGGTQTASSPTTACAPSAVSVAITGLAPQTTYTARFVVTNSQGTAATNPETFTTPAYVPPSGSGPGDGSGGAPPPPVVPPFAAPLRGTAGDDRLIGTSGPDKLRGFSGNDVLSGLAGDDLLDGGPGRDILLGGPGNDHLLGGPGADDLDGGDGNDRVEGGSGNDVIRGGAGRDSFSGGSGNDILRSADGVAEKVDCGRGRDRIRADWTDRLKGCERVARAGKKPKKKR